MRLSPLRSLILTAMVFAFGIASAPAQEVVEEIEAPAIEETEVKGSSIPEPTVAGLIGFVGLMIILRGRRRR